MSITTFAEMLKQLLDESPYAAEDLADALHVDGVSMSERVVARLLAGIGSLPSDSTIASIARFFEVEPDYFFPEWGEVGIQETSDAPGDQRREGDRQAAVGGQKDLAIDIGTQSGAAQYVISRQWIGRLIRGLSVAADGCIDGYEVDVVLASTLARTIGSISLEISQAEGAKVTLSQSLLEEMVVAWSRSAPSEGSSRDEYLWAAELLGRRPTA